MQEFDNKKETIDKGLDKAVENVLKQSGTIYHLRRIFDQIETNLNKNEHIIKSVEDAIEALPKPELDSDEILKNTGVITELKQSINRIEINLAKNDAIMRTVESAIKAKSEPRYENDNYKIILDLVDQTLKKNDKILQSLAELSSSVPKPMLDTDQINSNMFMLDNMLEVTDQLKSISFKIEKNLENNLDIIKSFRETSRSIPKFKRYAKAVYIAAAIIVIFAIFQLFVMLVLMGVIPR